jgi:hypothetical protein
LNGVDGFNAVQHIGSTQLNTVQRQPSMRVKSPGEVAIWTAVSERLKEEK